MRKSLILAAFAASVLSFFSATVRCDAKLIDQVAGGFASTAPGSAVTPGGSWSGVTGSKFASDDAPFTSYAVSWAQMGAVADYGLSIANMGPSSGDRSDSATSNSGATYSLYVAGNGLVPLDASFFLLAFSATDHLSNNGASASASFSCSCFNPGNTADFSRFPAWTGSGFSIGTESGTGGTTGIEALAFASSPFFLVEANTVYAVSLSASGRSDATDEARGFAEYAAAADPYFAIDPSYLVANPSTQLFFSPGIINSPETFRLPLPVPFLTPEPSDVSLLVVGLTFLGAMRRRPRFVNSCVTKFGDSRRSGSE